MTQTDTRGGVAAVLIRFSLPLIISGILQQLYNWADAFIVGHAVGESALAAVGATTAVSVFFTMAITGFTQGLSILAAQRFGSGDRAGLRPILSTFLVVLLPLAVLCAALGVWASGSLLHLLHTPENILAFAGDYLRIIFIGVPFLAAYNLYSALLRAMGDSRAPFYAVVVSSLANVALDLWFVAGLGMGTAGAALATTAAQAVSFGMALVLVARRTGLLQPKLSFFRMHGALLRLILRLGIPSALQMTIAGFSWLVVTFLVNQYGVDVSAGNGVAIKIKDICQLFISAMASGATTMIAQNLGASKFERAKDVMYTAMKITCAMAAAMIVLVELFAPQMAAVFTNEAAVRDAAVLNLRIEILGQVFYAVFLVYHALMLGAGDTWWVFLSSFANCIVFRVVLSLLFNHLWGIYGLYAACAVAPSISVPLGWLYTRSGVWRRSLAKTEK